MSYQTDDGQHEGWEAAEFPDGRFSVGSGNGGALVRWLRPELDTETEPGVLDGRTAIGWRGVCECGWRGPLWERIANPMEPDLSEHKIFEPAPSVYGDVPERIEDAIYREWLGHLPALGDVRTAAEEARRAEARLDEAVRRARAGGSSWAVIGDAAGITRQSAHERWRADQDQTQRRLVTAGGARDGREDLYRMWPGVQGSRAALHDVPAHRAGLRELRADVQGH